MFALAAGTVMVYVLDDAAGASTAWPPPDVERYTESAAIDDEPVIAPVPDKVIDIIFP